MTQSSKPVATHLPCPCGSSSDAFSVYSDNHGHCFSCSRTYPELSEDFLQKNFTAQTRVRLLENQGASYHQSISRESNINFSYEYLPWRGVNKETMSFFEVRTKIDESGQPVSIGFPYTPEALKVRSLHDKTFHSVGPMSEAALFGKDRFPLGSARSITITEGELDALSVFQMLGSQYPVVSVRSASSAERDCKLEREYLNSFEKIYLCLDSDTPGQEATRKIAKLFDFNKVYHVKLPEDLKDANGFLQRGLSQQFKSTWWNSKRFLPEGIISSQSEFDDIIENDTIKTGVAYPFKTLQEMTYGIRTGEATLFTALEGIGKTEVLRAIEYHLLRTTDDNLGIIHLEEGKARTLKGLAGYHLKTPVHLPDSIVTKEVTKEALKEITRRDDRLHIYSHFGSDDPNVILDTIRFLATSCNCKYVFLDHISMVVSGLNTDKDERKVLDYISTRLETMVEELDFALIYVSHVNDDGLTRGSRNISKTAHTWIHLDRNKLADTEEEKNTTKFIINKNRFGARTGYAGEVYFDIETFMVTDKSLFIDLPPVTEKITT
jgi:twinkle protein